MNLASLFHRKPVAVPPGRHTAQWTSLQLEVAELRQRPTVEALAEAVRLERQQLAEVHAAELGQMRVAHGAECRGWHKALDLAAAANGELVSERDALKVQRDDLEKANGRLEASLTALLAPVDAEGVDVPAAADVEGSCFQEPTPVVQDRVLRIVADTPPAAEPTPIVDLTAKTQAIDVRQLRQGLDQTAEFPVPDSPDSEDETRPLATVGHLTQLAST